VQFVSQGVESDRPKPETKFRVYADQMGWTPIICPSCRRGRALRGTHICQCGQRFKLPKGGRLLIVVEEDAETLFYLPQSRQLVRLEEVMQRASARDPRVRAADVLQVRVEDLEPEPVPTSPPERATR